MKALILLSLVFTGCAYPKLKAFECGEVTKEFFDENGHAIERDYRCQEFYHSEFKKKDD
jgi:hypothetical protein